MKNILLTILFASAVLFAGCDSKKEEKPQQLPVVVLPSGEEVLVQMQDISPKSTEYEGEGIKFHRKVDISRFFDITGVSPGETISRQQPASIQTGAAPAINISPDGVGVTATKDDTKFVGGSGKWSALDTIWQRIKDFFKVAIPFLLIGAVALFVLPIFFPALAPIANVIIAGLGKFVSWLVPIFGGLIEWIKGLFTKKVVENQTQAIKNFEDTLAADTRVPEDVKDYVLSMLNTAHEKAHDKDTKEYVAKVKATLK